MTISSGQRVDYDADTITITGDYLNNVFTEYTPGSNCSISIKFTPGGSGSVPLIVTE